MSWLWKCDPLKNGRPGLRALFRLLWGIVGGIVAAIAIIGYLAYGEQPRDAVPLFVWGIIALGPVIVAGIGYCIDVIRYGRITRQGSPQASQ